ncbi:MAG: repressor LexA [Patescibacteria group bacterium]|nr:repressor LexA [Patescibacteria group bacterium]
MSDERATKRQQELLGFVDGFIKGNGYGPSYREIMRALGYKSVSTVAIHVDALIAKGYLARRDKSARSLEVISLRPDMTSGASSQRSQPDSVLNEIQTRLNAAELSEEQRQDVVAALKLISIDLQEGSDT